MDHKANTSLGTSSTSIARSSRLSSYECIESGIGMPVHSTAKFFWQLVCLVSACSV